MLEKKSEKNKGSLKLKIYESSLCILFFLMLFFPFSYQKIKILFVVITFFIGSLYLKNIKRESFLVVLVYTLTFFFFGIWGIVNGNLGALQLIKLHILWVIIFCVMFSGIKISTLRKIKKTFFFTIWSIVIYNIVSFLIYINGFSSKFYKILDTGTDIGIHEGYSQINSNNIGSLIFLISFLIVKIYYEFFFKKIKKSTLILLILFVIVAVISGRRMLQIMILISSVLGFLLLFFNLKLNKNKLIKVIGIALGSLWGIYLYFLLNPIFFSRIYEGIFTDKNDSNINVRYIQTSILVKEILNGNLYFGTGLGSVVKSIIRSEKLPWLVETANLKLFHEIGIIGSILIFSVLIYYVFLLKRCSKYKYFSYYLASLMATIAISIANFTNPYFANFDSMWIFVFPIFVYSTLKHKYKYKYNFRR